ncbi:MAG: YdeI/OmpD-associated family protein [Thermoanaerobaculia bacterium]
MGKRDPRVDAYIAKSADFAKPILEYLREVVHAGCPDVEETMKWSVPHFEYNGILCSMAAFKAHCAFGFWKGSLLPGIPEAKDGMGQFGRITSKKDLPPKKEMIRLVREAARLNEEGVAAPRAKRAKPPLPTPEDLAGALRRNKRARAAFEGFPPSHRREYIEWITEAKSEATRKERLAQAVEWMAEGKARNWKYGG